MTTNTRASHRRRAGFGSSESRFSDSVRLALQECAGEGWAAAMVALALVLAVVA